MIVVIPVLTLAQNLLSHLQYFCRTYGVPAEASNLTLTNALEVVGVALRVDLTSRLLWLNHERQRREHLPVALRNQIRTPHDELIPQALLEWGSVDAVLMRLFPWYDPELDSDHPNFDLTDELYCQFIDPMILEVGNYIDLAIPNPTWDIWTPAKLGRDLYLKKDEDYRLVDWMAINTNATPVKRKVVGRVRRVKPRQLPQTPYAQQFAKREVDVGYVQTLIKPPAVAVLSPPRPRVQPRVVTAEQINRTGELIRQLIQAAKNQPPVPPRPVARPKVEWVQPEIDPEDKPIHFSLMGPEHYTPEKPTSAALVKQFGKPYHEIDVKSSLAKAREQNERLARGMALKVLGIEPESNL